MAPTHIVTFPAAAYIFMRISDWDSEGVIKDINIQVCATAEILKTFLPIMAENNYGKIVAMLSSCTIGRPPKNLTGYTTVKYALMGLMKSAAEDYKDKGININGVSPAMIETKFVKGIGRKIREISAEQSKTSEFTSGGCDSSCHVPAIG